LRRLIPYFLFKKKNKESGVDIFLSVGLSSDDQLPSSAVNQIRVFPSNLKCDLERPEQTARFFDFSDLAQTVK
jgi:hypothetical protein